MEEESGPEYMVFDKHGDQFLLRLQPDEWNHALEIPEGILQMLKAVPIPVPFDPHEVDWDSDNHDDTYGDRHSLVNNASGRCAFCSKKLGSQTTVMINAMGFMPIMCSIICWTDSITHGWLNEQIADLEDRVEFRFKESEGFEGTD